MSRSTPSGPWNVGSKVRQYLSGLTTPAQIPQIGTVTLVQKVSRTYTESTSLAEDFAIVLPKHSTLTAIRTVDTTTGTTVAVRAGTTVNGQEIMASVSPTINTSVVRTIATTGVAATQAPTDDVTVYVRLTSTATLTGTIDVMFEYVMFADATREIAAPQV